MHTPRHQGFKLLVLTALLAVLALGAGVAGADDAKNDSPKYVILGFDGADPELIDKYMAEGLLPNLEALAKEGTYSPLLPTNPPQTPVSWSTFATGMNPGRTEIFDFLYRQSGSYTPELALATAGKKTLLLGRWNGLVLGSVLGLVLALVVLLVLKLCKVRSGWSLGVAALVLVAAALLLMGPIDELLPEELPTATNNRQGKPFWTYAAESGLNVRVVRVPVTFPAEELPHGSKMISGLGVPDMRRRVGTPTLFTSDPVVTAEQNEFSIEVTPLPSRRGKMETAVIGPYNYPFHVYVTEKAREAWTEAGLSAAERRERERELDAELVEAGHPKQMKAKIGLEVTDESVTWSLSGQSGTLEVGEWSDWVSVDFPMNWLIDKARPLRGMGRFKLLALEPEIELYFSPLNFHSGCRPPVDVSWPPEWAEEITKEQGEFKTQGWAIDTWTPVVGYGGIDLFVEDMNFTVDGFAKVMEVGLSEPSVDMYVQIYYFTDRAGHMFWHQLDPSHPLHQPELADQYEKAMRDAYVRMDELVGRARELAGDDVVFMVLSDHGFASFRRQVNINTWLYENGYLALKGETQTRNLEQLFDRHVTGVTVFSGIDWSRTKAWAMGLGAVYINQVGREPEGIVMPGEEYDQLVAEIKEGLENAVDEKTGVKPIYKVYTRDEMYGDYNEEKVADLRVANRDGYRVSWQDTLGGLSTTVFEDNPRSWTGDHCSLQPTEVRGIFFLNRPINVNDPGIVDIAPTILQTLGIEPEEKLDGRVIW